MEWFNCIITPPNIQLYVINNTNVKLVILSDNHETEGTKNLILKTPTVPYMFSEILIHLKLINNDITITLHHQNLKAGLRQQQQN